MENTRDLPADAAPIDPDEARVTEFWGFSREHVGWTTVEGIFGQQQASSVRPPWMHLAGTADASTELAHQFIAQRTLAMSVPLADYPSPDDLPARGDLAIVCDGLGHPVALAATLQVEVGDGEDDAGRMVTETLRCLYPTEE